MVRCPKCKTIQAKTATSCPVCGTEVASPAKTGSAAQVAAPATAPPAARKIVAGQEGPNDRSVARVAVAQRPARSSADRSAFAPGPSPAPPLGTGPVVLGPASDSGSHPSFPPGIPSAPYVSNGYTVAGAAGPVVVGPADAATASGRRTVAALIASTLVLVVLIGIVAAAVASQRTETVTQGDPKPTVTQAPTTSAAPETTDSKTPPTPASVSVSAQRSSVNTGEAVTVNVSFSGDPTQVSSTTLIINGLPSPETSQGLRNSFTVDGGRAAGDVEFKVAIALKDGRQIESNGTRVSVVTTTQPPPQTVTSYVYPPTTYDPCAGPCDHIGTSSTSLVDIRSGHSNIAVRRGPHLNSPIVKTVGSGDRSLYGRCIVKGDYAPASGNAPAGDNWILLSDGNYFWDSWTTNSWPTC